MHFFQLDSLMGPPQDLLSPFLYVHNLYSNMVDKLRSHATVSWSFYMQNNNGQLVVVKSEPQFHTSRVQNDIDRIDRLLDDSMEDG